MKTIYTLAFLMVSTLVLAQNHEEPANQDEFRLTGDSISFTLVIVNSYPFISGEINCVRGKFMLDKAHQGTLDINNNIVSLPSQKEKGNG